MNKLSTSLLTIAIAMGAAACSDSQAEPGGIAFFPESTTFFEPFGLRISKPSPDEAIRYTTDGSLPDASSPEFLGELIITNTIQVRAALFSGDDQISPVVSGTYTRIAGDVGALTSPLPRIVIQTFGDEAIDEEDRPRAYRPVYMMFLDENGLLDAETRAGMHVRGNSSLDYDKRQYRIELWDELDDDRNMEVLGMPKEADFVLHAPYSDKTLMRNHLMYGWSNRIGRYAPRTRLVEVFIDRDGDILDMDDYEGVFLWTEKIQRDGDRVAISKMAPTDIVEPEVSGGYLLARDWGFEEQGSITTSVYEDFLLIEYPKPENLATEQRDWLAGYLDDFEAALAGPDFADPSAGYAPFIDVDSFIDHHLLNELARNVDAFVLSTYLHKDRGGPLTMGPIWDFNGALGNADYFEAWDPEGWHHENPEFPADNPNGYRWYERLFEDPDFQARYAARWSELRAGPLSTSMLLDDIANTAQLLAEPAARNFERWEILGEYVWPNDEGAESRTTYGEEVDYLQSWLLARLAWMDMTLAIP